MAQAKPPLNYTVLKYLGELDRDMTAMENAIVALSTMPKDSADYKPALKKLRKDQKEMAKKLEDLQKFDNQAKEQISDIMVTAIRLLGRLNLNSDDEQEYSAAATIADQPPPTMTFIRRWTIERLGFKIAKSEAAPEDLQIGHADDDDLQGEAEDETTGGGKTEVMQSSVPEEKRSSSSMGG